MKKLDITKSVHDLVAIDPEVKAIMAEAGFKDITNPIALNSVGKIMTIPKGSAIKGIPMDHIRQVFAAHGFELVEGEAAPAPAPAQPKAEASDLPEKAETKEDRARLLEDYVRRLSAGEDLESVRADFVRNFETVDASEIMDAEQKLIRGGVPAAKVQKLCDVHSALFHGAACEGALDVDSVVDAAVSRIRAEGQAKEPASQKMAKDLIQIQGHPLQIFHQENEKIQANIEAGREAADAYESGEGTEAGLRETLSKMRMTALHYAKKGDLIYPVLKVNYHTEAPSQVMWGVDDEIRDAMSELDGASAIDGKWLEDYRAVLTRAEEMIFKEESILYPICAQNLQDEEWKEMYREIQAYPPVLLGSYPVWKEAEEAEPALEADFGGAGEVTFPSGHLTPRQIRGMLNTIPMEITFIDEDSINRYFDESGDKLFKRPLSALDREVWHCHPPKIEEMVRQIIRDLKAGKRDSFDVWMQKGGEPVLVRYMAVRDEQGYVGTMECVQKMGFAEKHFEED